MKHWSGLLGWDGAVLHAIVICATATRTAMPMPATKITAKIKEAAPGLALLCLEERIRLGLGDHPIGHGLLERSLIGRLDGGLERRIRGQGCPADHKICLGLGQRASRNRIVDCRGESRLVRPR